MRISMISLSALALATATPAFAQEAETDPAPAITVSGSITAVTDYRFRGLTQSDEKPALQGTVNVNHESGLYVGTFVSTIDGGLDGSTPALTGYGDVEIDFYGGFTKTTESGVGVDVGLLYYYYADGVKGLDTDFFEPYASVSYTIGPVAAKVGAAYAWGGQAGLAFAKPNDENIYVYGDLSTAIPSTPVTVKAHVGYTDGSLGLVNLTADDNYFDWSLSAEGMIGPVKVGVSYVDTDVTETVVGGRKFAQRLGRGSTVLGYIGFSF